MACIYESEKRRQEALLRWHTEFFPELQFTVPSQSSGTGSNDGQFVVNVNGHNYLFLLVEVKNELGSSGDPYYQLQRYHQACWGKRGGGWCGF